MKRIILTLAVVLMGAAGWAAGMVVPLSEVIVVAPDDYFGADRMGSVVHWGGGAANDLTNALAKVLGRTVPLFPESCAPKGTCPVLYLGDVAAAREADVADASLRNLDYRIVVCNGNVFIWSRTGTGASYGVTDFLERFCGYRFLTTSGDDPYEVRPDASVPPCDLTGRSAIYRHTIGAGRGPGAAKRPKTQKLWPGDRSGFSRRVRLSLREEDIEGSEQISEQTGVKCHSSYSYLPPKKYWNDHPEYYCMDESGKRFCQPDARYSNGQICYSNPDVRRICLESLLAFIERDRKKHPDNPPLVYDMTQQDAMNFLCLCPECKKIIAKYNRTPGGHAEGGDAGLQLEFINDLARKAAAKYPGVQIRTFAYVSTEVPPAGGIRPEDNVIIWMCDLYTRCNHMLPLSHPFNAPRRKLIEDWAAISKRLEIWDYMLYNVDYSRGRLFPEVSVDAIASDAKFFRDLGLPRLYMETEYADQPFWELNVHVMDRFYRDPDYDLGKAIDEYCTVYGKGAGKMREAIDLLRETILANPPREWQARILSWRNVGFYERVRKPIAEAYALETDRVKRARIAKVLACIDDELAHLRNGTPEGRAQAKRDRENWFAFKLEDALAEFDDEAARETARAGFEKQVAEQKALDELRFRDMPSVTEGKAVDDLFCIDWRRSHAFSKFGKVEDDPRSETGKTIYLAEGESSAIPLECGVSDTGTWKRFDFKVDCSAQPEDGAYRWYRAGEATLRRGAFFWFPKSWKCRFELGHCFVNCDGADQDINRVSVWVSVARREGRLAVDRVVLRRITDEDPGEVAVPAADVPQAWRLPRIPQFGGRDFLPVFRAYKWPEHPETCPERMSIFEDCVVKHYQSAKGFPGGGGLLGLNDYMRHPKYRNAWVRPVPEEYRRKTPYTIDDFGTDYRDQVNPRRPFMLALHKESRPCYFLRDDGYPLADRASWKSFLDAWPGFVGFSTLGEFDSDTLYYGYYADPKTTQAEDPAVRDFFLKKFPPAEKGWNVSAWAQTCFRNERDLHFGEERLWAMNSGVCGLQPAVAALGADNGFFYEATSQSHASWQIAGAFTRGAARQFSKPFGWYSANWYQGYDRAGKCHKGENRWSDFHSYKSANTGVHLGSSRSLIDRQNAYGYLIGACMLQIENWPMVFATEKDGVFVPSDEAHDFETLYRMSKRLDRGVPYTPMAILVPIDEPTWTVGWCGELKDKFTQTAFVHTLVPLNCDSRWAVINKVGEQGCLYNAPYGETFDMLVPDGPAAKRPFAETLSAYKVAFLCGTAFDAARFDREALERFVENGGTLYVAADQIAAGLVPADFAGAKPSAAASHTASGLVTDGGSWQFSLNEPYACAALEMTTARPYLTTADGCVVAVVRDFGKGRIVTVAADSMLPEKYRQGNRANLEKDYEHEFCEISSGRQRFSILAAFFARVRDTTMPVSVLGDCQWGVNRTAKGWLVWVFNNKGVVKWSYEPESFDATKTTAVRIAPTGSVRFSAVRDARTGEVRSIAADGSVSVVLAPGRWTALELN